MTWYESLWPWVGLGGAIAILILSFFTDFLQSNKLMSKWKDPTWLAWLCTASYLVHNVEEYGIDLTGKLYAFPECFNQIMVGSGQSVTGIFFMAINIPAFWITFPLISVYSKKHQWISPLLAAGLFCNAISHVIPIIVGTGYTPGTLTAIIIFFPVSIWSTVALFGKDKLSYDGVNADLTITAKYMDFYKLRIGQLNPKWAFLSKKFQVKGDISITKRLAAAGVN